MRTAAEAVRRLFPNSAQEDISGQRNEIENAEISEDFNCLLATEINTETGEVIPKEGEEELEMEKELIAGVIAHAPPGIVTAEVGVLRYSCLRTRYCRLEKFSW